MKTDTLFNGKAEDYAKYRPGYPLKLINLLESEINFDETKDIADIGSGTGTLTKLFLLNDNLVFGVEPNEEMRVTAEKNLDNFYNFISVNGTAEKTNLADSSVDIITAGQSFHWFDSGQAKNEFRRIVRKDGYVVLVWNVMKRNFSNFLKAYVKFVENLSPEMYNKHIEGSSEETMKKFFGDTKFNLKSIDNQQILDWKGLRGNLLSVSFLPKEEAAQKKLLDELKAIFDKHNINGKVIIDYSAKVFYGKIK